jgi:hypothetical protein
MRARVPCLPDGHEAAHRPTLLSKAPATHVSCPWRAARHIAACASVLCSAGACVWRTVNAAAHHPQSLVRSHRRARVSRMLGWMYCKRPL